MTDPVPSKENLQAAQKAVGQQTDKPEGKEGKPDITFPFPPGSTDLHALMAHYVAMERRLREKHLQDEVETEEGRKQGRYRLEKQSASQAHRFRSWALLLMLLFSLIPAGLLGIMGWSVFFCGPDGFAQFVSNHQLGEWPVGVFIFGVFTSFIVVFSFLAKGAFSHSRRKDNDEEESPNGLVPAVRILADKLAEIFSRKPPE